EQTDIETVLARVKIGRFFFRRQQIEQQGGKSRIIERARDKLIARAVPAATATVRKEHERLRLIDNRQIAVEHCAAGRDSHFTLAHALPICRRLSSMSMSTSKSRNLKP